MARLKACSVCGKIHSADIKCWRRDARMDKEHHDDQVPVEVQGGAIIAHPRHGQGLGTDPFEL